MSNPVQSFYRWYSQTIRNPRYRWLVVMGSLAYLLSPLDFAPDLIPILGWIDDGVIATLLVTELSQLLFSTMAQSNREAPTNPGDDDDEGPVIDVTPH